MAVATFAAFLKDYKSAYLSWASEADTPNIKEPSAERILMGWVIEQPKHTFLNWHMNRVDQRLLYLEAYVDWLEQKRAEEKSAYETRISAIEKKLVSAGIV